MVDFRNTNYREEKLKSEYTVCETILFSIRRKKLAKKKRKK